MLYRITEIFRSIQGEGYWTGTPAIFVRLAGCNLQCPWCDTDHIMRIELTQAEIVHEIKHLDNGVPLIVLTGGEPTIQNLLPLVQEIKYDNLFDNKTLAIETNGTYISRVPTLIDWVTVSPKFGHINFKYNERIRGDEIKVVLDGKINPVDIHTVFAGRFDHWYIQPCSGNYQPAIQFVEENPRWKLSLQTQKILNIS